MLTLQVQQRSVSFQEQIVNLIYRLTEIYERKQNWKEAASVLSGIPLETGTK